MKTSMLDLESYLSEGTAVVTDIVKTSWFIALRAGDTLLEEHKGGCVLFEQGEALLMKGQV